VGFDVPSTSDLTAESLDTTVEPLADRLVLAAVAAVSPILLTSLLIAGYVGIAGPDTEIPRTVVDTAYGVSALAVLGAVYAALGTVEWRAAMPLGTPTRAELGWTVICLPLAIGAFVLGSTVGELLGFELSGISYSLSNTPTLAAVVFGGILVAPLVEELLFRGLLLGSLLDRGLSPLAAGAASVLLFAAIHLISLGPAGVLAIAGWAVFPTLLRLKFDNLAGAWLLHLVNNVWAYVIVVALGWA
jgi:membrane protease YdiL (CAAX protease family)